MEITKEQAKEILVTAFAGCDEAARAALRRYANEKGPILSGCLGAAYNYSHEGRL